MRTLLNLSWACLAVLAAAGTAAASGPADARGQLIHRSIDPGSGATIRLYQRTPADLTLEVEAKGVKVTKRFGGKESLVTVTSATDRISFAVTPEYLVVSGPASQARLTKANAAAEHAPIERLVRASSAYRDGVALLKTVKVPQRSPLSMLILPTRAFLEGALGDTSARAEMRQWARAVAPKPRVVRVGFQRDASDCWNLYSQEVIEAWMELEDCLANAPWQAWPWTTNCWGLYDIRAIGAAAWWAKCVAIS